MKLKTHCIKCGNEIGGNLEENYEKRGNYCISCDNRSEECALIKRLKENPQLENLPCWQGIKLLAQSE